MVPFTALEDRPESIDIAPEDPPSIGSSSTISCDLREEIEVTSEKSGDVGSAGGGSALNG